MLLQTGHSLGTEHLAAPGNGGGVGGGGGSGSIAGSHQQLQLQQPASITSSSSASSTPPIQDLSRYLETIQERLKEGWTVHTAKDGRLYYCNHITRTAGWLPPIENWGQNIDLPYAWEKAIDQKGQPYYINHLNKTTTYEPPERYPSDEPPPEPRLVVLQRSPTLGFGFVAGSEKPVIVRFVTEGGPSVNKLEPGDQILSVNGEDVKDAPRDHVIQLVRNCEHNVSLLVCQPRLCNGVGRKSTLLSAGKKAKLKSRPTRVRFAESVCVNGAPLFPPSAFSLGDLCVPPMANVLKVFLENGQTKSFKYDSTTTVQDVITSLRDKLCLTAGEHFSLVLEHVKSLKRNKLTLLDPQETVAKIAARPGAHKLRCLFRVTFVPVTAAELAQKDLNALDYLYMQCCNDVTQERFAPELQPEVALRLAALHMHQHALANNISPVKLTVKVVEREFGLERFVPASLIEGMKRKELRRLIGHFLKLNSQMTGSANKTLTQLQAKIHYLDIISGLPSYGAKCFSTNQRDGVERVLLVSPRFGLSQIAGVRNSVPQPIATIEELSRVVITREDDITYAVTVYISADRVITFSMEDRDASEFAIVLAGYYRLLAKKELPVDKDRCIMELQQNDDIAPPYLSQHTVLPSIWSYLPTYFDKYSHSMAFLMPPPYHSTKSILSNTSSNNSSSSTTTSSSATAATAAGKGAVDNNMNSALQSNYNNLAYSENNGSVSSMFAPSEDSNSANNKFVDARNEEVLRRVVEMQKMVESSEKYLNENNQHPHLQLLANNNNNKHYWRETSVDIESDCDSMNSSKQSSNEDSAIPPPGTLKHSDSLVLLAETINLDLSGITRDLNSIFTSTPTKGLSTFMPQVTSTPNANDANKNANAPSSQQNTPKFERRMQGLSQILSDLQALGNDLSHSESDTDSIYTPNSSPIHRNLNGNANPNKNNIYRTSFGLHSPDNSLMTTGGDGIKKEINLKEYLRQLKEASQNEIYNNKDAKLNGGAASNTDLAAKKLSELYGYELIDNSIIETDPDIIDLRTLPPPQTPDELDTLNVLSMPPSGFDDKSTNKSADLEEFLKKVIIEPPTQLKLTPAVELTPEEILSYIIPPPPDLSERNASNKINNNNNTKNVCNSVSNNTSTNNNNNTQINNNVSSLVDKNVPKVKPKPNPKPRQFQETNQYQPQSFYHPPHQQFQLATPPPPPPPTHPKPVVMSSADTDLYSNTTAIYNNHNNNHSIKSNGFACKTSATTNGGGTLQKVEVQDQAKQVQQTETQQNHIIEYPTVDRKGTFLCCSNSSNKSSSPSSVSSSSSIINTINSSDNKNDNNNNDNNCSSHNEANMVLALPPKRCQHSAHEAAALIPDRPPKSAELQFRLNSPVKRCSPSPIGHFNGGPNKFMFNGGEMGSNNTHYSFYDNNDPPILPPRFEKISPPLSVLPPKKPPLPPAPILKNSTSSIASSVNSASASASPTPRSPIPILKNSTLPSPMNNNELQQMKNNSSIIPIRTAGIGSPHFHRHPNSYRNIERAFNYDEMSDRSMSPTPAQTFYHQASPSSPQHQHQHQQQHQQHQHQQLHPQHQQYQLLQQQQQQQQAQQQHLMRSTTNGHFRSNSDSPAAIMMCENNKPPQLSILCSPQMPRKIINYNGTNAMSTPPASVLGSPILLNRNGHSIINIDTLLVKTDIAMAGLLVKLDQVAAMCSAAQTAGGGSSIDEEKFQQAKNELTDQALHLVTSSKHLVVAMSESGLATLPEHLTACLTELRRITELAQDLIRHTSSPLQTRNIVLKIHDVASSFRELACVRVGDAGQLALQAECLANVLATLLRSLRVFSP